jgi:hypothetical protein
MMKSLFISLGYLVVASAAHAQSPSTVDETDSVCPVGGCMTISSSSAGPEAGSEALCSVYADWDGVHSFGSATWGGGDHAYASSSQKVQLGRKTAIRIYAQRSHLIFGESRTDAAYRYMRDLAKGLYQIECAALGGTYKLCLADIYVLYPSGGGFFYADNQFQPGNELVLACQAAAQ